MSFSSLTPQEKISEAVNSLHASLNSFISKTAASDHLSLITVHVYEHGLSSLDLKTAIETLTRPSSLLPSQRLQFVKLLLPRDKVDDVIVFQIVSAIGSGKHKIEFAVQAALLKWLVLVQPFLKNFNSLSRVYGVLFMLLSYESIRPWVAHLLFLTTRRKDITPWRIQYLLELHNRYRESLHLQGLLILYKEYYPEIIIDNYINIRRALFNYPDSKFIKIIQSIHFSASTHPNYIRNGLNATKRRKLRIPDSTTIDTTASSITVEDLTTLSLFVQNIHSVELPAQMGSALRYEDTVKRIMVNRPSDIALVRLDTWLAATLLEELRIERESNDSDSLEELLQRTYELISYTKEYLISVQDFLLNKFLPTWDGRNHRKIILNLLTLLPLSTCDGLLPPLVKLFEQSSNDGLKVDILIFLADISQRHFLKHDMHHAHLRGTSAPEIILTLSSIWSCIEKLSLLSLQSPIVEGARLNLRLVAIKKLLN
ncbi:centromere protein I [Lipomyces japonicus]|uniref:centromere protein I n=1 Tax=Lipomyces japonicus TaxID=56871 RepID=UPI0034D01FC1